MPLFQGIKKQSKQNPLEEGKNTSKQEEDFDISQDKSIQEAIAMMGGKPKAVVQEKKFKSIVMGSANLVQIDLKKDIDKQVNEMLLISKTDKIIAQELEDTYGVDLKKSEEDIDITQQKIVEI